MSTAPDRDPRLAQRIFVGRQREREQFRYALDRMHQEYLKLQEMAEAIGPAFDPGAAPRDDYPRVFLLHGIGGIGKTELTRNFLAIVEEEYTPPFHRTYIDVSKATSSLEAISLLELIARELEPAFPGEFNQFYQLIQRHPYLERQREQYKLENHDKWQKYLDLAARTATAATNIATQAAFGVELGETGEGLMQSAVSQIGHYSQEVLKRAEQYLLQDMVHEGLLTEVEIQQLNDPIISASDTFVQCLKRVASATPLVIALDTVETIVNLESILCNYLLDPCRRESVIFVISGQHNLARERRVQSGAGAPSRRSFSDLLTDAPVVIDVAELREPDIRRYVVKRAEAQNLHIEPTEELVRTLRTVSGGIPLALEMAVDALLTLGADTFKSDFASDLDWRRLMPHETITEITDRFLRYCIGKHPADEDQVYALAILNNRPRESALAEVWKLPSAEQPRDIILELEYRYSFIQDGRLHDAVRRFLRLRLKTDHLLIERAKQFGQRAATHYNEQWAIEADLEKDIGARYNEKRYLEVILDLLNAGFWADWGHAIPLLTTAWLEASVFNASFCLSLVHLAAEFSDRDYLRERDRRLVNLFRALTDGASEASSTNPGVQDHHGANERLQRLQRLRREIQGQRGVEPIHHAFLSYLIIQTLEELGKPQEALKEVVSGSSGVLQHAGEQASFRTVLAERIVRIAGPLIYETNDSPAEIIEALQTAALLDSKNSYPWFGLAFAYQTFNQHQEAIDAYQKAIELDPQDATAWYNLGNTYRHLKQYEEAIAAYQNAIELDPEDAKPSNNLGTVYNNLQRYEEAIAAYRKAIELDSQFAAAWYNLGIVYNNLQRYEEAIAAYRKAIELDSQDASPWNNLGIVYNNLQRYKEAIGAFRKAVELDPQSATAWNNLGLQYMQQNELDRAIQAFNRCIELSPSDALGAHVSLGIIFQHRGNPDASRFSFIAALDTLVQAQLNKVMSDAGLLECKAQALLCLGETDEAIATLQEAIKAMTSKSEIDFTLYDLLATAPEPPAGLEEMRRMLEEALDSFQQGDD